MKSSQSTHPELPLFNSDISVVVRQQINRPSRAKDSEGRFVCDVNIPNHEVFIETQTRREDSVYKLLRLMDEEIHQLKEEIKKYKHDQK